MNEEEKLKLIDICDSALFFLKHKKVISFDTFQHGNITIDEASDFVEEMFQKTEMEY